MTYSYHGMEILLTAWGPSQDYTVTTISVSGNSEPKTADGVGVGMPETVLSRIYGTADSVSTERHKVPKLSEKDNEEYRNRLDKTVYAYNADECVTMTFIVKEGIIKTIHIHAGE
ncbi:hypothetical protein TAMA11512_24020 [Selenomonas sp. TAMA-11512]|uniref:hypothetical protein n=1 Tax=Selenomonas sp. TAMA-11512 TaxID=3095337 RepID=UPI00309330CA|nr:hypothetical protein TAMA11512_24020 [Selenomonas sp. TAMA-11512]